MLNRNMHENGGIEWPNKHSGRNRIALPDVLKISINMVYPQKFVPLTRGKDIKYMIQRVKIWYFVCFKSCAILVLLASEVRYLCLSFTRYPEER